ncbi:MAG: methionine--tRNA ligase [Candidatus Woesearchaeota archaeon]
MTKSKVKASNNKINNNKINNSYNQHKILVTSALPYANGSIHLGHLVEYIQTDIFVRFLKLIGKDAIYCCADDTHGTPIEIKAKQLGIRPEELIAKYWKEHTKDFADFHIKFDSYYSTNSVENKEYSVYIYEQLKKKGLIYRKKMQLIYCNHCKRFLPDRFVKGTCPVPECNAEDQYGDICEKCGNTHNTTDLINPKCTICGNKPVEKESEHYFFRLSRCKDQLIHFLQSALQKKKLQKEVVNFCMNWIEKLEDWCISRDGPYFGFEIPDSKKETGDVKYFYVWLDAPVGYIASTANYCKNAANAVSCKDDADVNDKEIKKKDKKSEPVTEKDYWTPKKPEDSEIIHIIGKDIVYFHYLFWPAMLENAGIKVPDQIMTHGFLTVNKEKMSKSRGTFITARHYLKYLDPQYLRFYYAANLTAKMEDIDLDIKDFKERINSELIGNLGNFGYRTVSFINKNFDSKIGEFDVEDKNVQKIINEFKKSSVEIRKNYHDFEFREVVKQILHLSSLGNKYFQDNEPWKLVKSICVVKGSCDKKNNNDCDKDKEKAHKVLSFCFHILKNLGIMIYPIMPMFAERLYKQLNIYSGDSGNCTKRLAWDDIHFDMKNHKINNGEILVKKIEDEIEDMIKNNTDEFNLNLKVCKVLEVKDHPNADRLYLLNIDLGKNKEGKEDRRQLVAGLKQHLSKEDLLGKHLIVAANLEPAKLKGETSEGMLLAAEIVKKAEDKDSKKKKEEKVVVLEAANSKVGSNVYPEGNKPDKNKEWKTITFKEFLENKFVVKNKQVFDMKRGVKALTTDKEKVKADIEDGAKVC